MKRRKKLLSVLLVLVMMFSLAPQVLLVPAAAADSASFTDISGHWARDYIEDAAERGLFAGTAPNVFSPELSMTRAMFVEVLYRASGECVEDNGVRMEMPFVDVKQTDYYYKALVWAYACGIVSGVDATHFVPDSNVTREQIVKMLYYYLKYTCDELQLDDTINIRFADSGSISNYARESVAYMTRAGVISGMIVNGERYFAPKECATRAQAATIFCQFLDNLEQVWDADEPDEPDDPIDPADPAVETDVEDTLIAVEDSYRGEDNWVPLDEVPAMFDEMEELAQYWMDEGYITYYERQETAFFVIFASGLHYFYFPDVAEFAEYAGGGSGAPCIQIYEPCLTRGNTWGTLSGESYFSKYQRKYGWIDDLADTIIAADSRYSFTTDCDDYDVQVSAVMGWKPNSIIIWQGHGGYTAETGSILMIGVDATEESKAFYRDFLYSSHPQMISSNNGLGVTPAFFEENYASGSLDGSLIFLGACESMRDNRLVDVLRSKGAKTVLGTSASMNIAYLVEYTNLFFQQLCTLDKSGLYCTVTEAMDYAKSESSFLHEHMDVADMLYAGDGNFRLNAVADICGTVTDFRTGAAISGAMVLIGGKNTGVRTASDGSFTVHDLLPNVTYAVTISAEGYADTSRNVMATAYAPKPASFEMTSNSGKISVRLQPDKGTVSGGSFTIYEVDGIDLINPRTQSFTGDTIALAGLENGVRYELVIAPDRYAETSKIITAVTTPLTHVIDVTLTAKTTVCLHVTDAETGTGINGGQVVLFGRTSDTAEWTQLAELTTANLTGGIVGNATAGWAQFEADPDYMSFKAEVSADGYEPATVTGSPTAAGESWTGSVQLTETEKEPEFTPIYTAADLAALEAGENAILMNDITVPAYIARWEGILEGNGHTITAPASAQYDAGTAKVACWVGMNTGTIRNVTFENVEISNLVTTGTTSHTWIAAALIAMNQGTVENCTVRSGSISASAVGTVAEAESFVFYNYETGVIRNCISMASISATAKNYFTTSGGTSYSCYGGAFASGILGNNYGGLVERCLNLGSISANSQDSVFAAGICCAPADGVITGCANMGTVTATTTGTDLEEDQYGLHEIAEICTDCYTTHEAAEGVTKVTESQIQAMWPQAF